MGNWRIVVFVIVLIALPVVFRNPYLTSVLVIIGLYGIVAMGLGLLLGFTGQISISQAAFYGIGAYTSAILTVTYGVSPWVAIIAGCVISAIVALVIGWPTLKLEENYLALATLGFGFIVYISFMQMVELTGGPSGIRHIPPLSLGFMTFDTDVKYYYLVWVVALGLLYFSSKLVKSRVGRALRAIRSSEIAAKSVGINPTKFKVQVFMLSAVFASIAGSLYAHYVSFISPSPFYVTASINFVIIAVIGGLTNIWGGLVGAAVITGLGELVREVVPLFIPDAGSEYELILFGVILVVTMIFMPQGLSVGVKDGWMKWAGRSKRIKNIKEGEMNNENTVA
ncbi:branched-chain amino acid ABC transporter permease [Cytobacillus depressus]|uniref:Branched-chain amino acid ABC transporter permease n=2 Tax=Cytobacillus depressus TaxID=1602942 RepID=A0A6L3V0F7_9BACI|nr:branched-chain amino acid ABC transporter permease [Cytobacillus depressus]